MENYFENQRYSSIGEPELGVGIIKEAGLRQVKAFFPLANETRIYSVESAALRRVIYKAGDTVIDNQNQTLLINRVELEDELYVYYGHNRKLSEVNLGNMLVKNAVDERLFQGDVDSPSFFALRRETLQLDYRRRLSVVNGFLGGRIDLIPHQLYIAHEVSSRYAPRVLLSDQVGLGKTIEACLILHRLLLSGRISRVIILVPESLVHQWFVEMLRRFNLWFNIFDEERCAALDSGAPSANPFLDNQLIICSTEFLSVSDKRASQAISAGWDMMVVDEAHHLEWSELEVSPAYNVVEQLSKAAKGLLLLTATPEQLGEESHFARLRLLDPSRYADFTQFLNEASDTSYIANIVDKLHLGKSLIAKEIGVLNTFFPTEKLECLTTADNVAKDKLIEDLLDQYGPGRVLFRNTRLAITGFPTRKPHLVPIAADDNSGLWMRRLADEFADDLSPSAHQEAQLYWFGEDPRVEWLNDLIMELYPFKILLICKSKEKVLALEKALSIRSNLKVAVFHEDLTIVQRDKNAAWFSEQQGAQLLLCSEIGSEGRNFQFAHHLVLFDVPLHPELLEQRIGRLDRIGQVAEIQVYVPYVVNSPQQGLVQWFHNGLNAFELNVDGGNEIFKIFSQRLLALCNVHDLSAVQTDLDALIAETSVFRKQQQKRLADGRDRLLEMNSFRPVVATKLVEQIQAEDSDKTLEVYFTKVLQHFDVEMEDLAPRTYFLQPASEIADVFPTIPRQGVCVTFDRKRALLREDISFLSWDHPMTTAAIDMVLSSDIGSASFAVMRGSKRPGMMLEILFVLETTSEQKTSVDRFFPNTPLRVVVDHTGNDLTEIYSSELFDKKLIPGNIEPFLDNDMLVEQILPSMILAATKVGESQRVSIIVTALEQMNLTLNHEIARLRLLQQRNNNVRSEEIEIAVNEQLLFERIIQNVGLRMEGIMLILNE